MLAQRHAVGRDRRIGHGHFCVFPNEAPRHIRRSVHRAVEIGLAGIALNHDVAELRHGRSKGQRCRSLRRQAFEIHVRLTEGHGSSAHRRNLGTLAVHHVAVVRTHIVFRQALQRDVAGLDHGEQILGCQISLLIIRRSGLHAVCAQAGAPLERQSVGLKGGSPVDGDAGRLIHQTSLIVLEHDFVRSQAALRTVLGDAAHTPCSHVHGRILPQQELLRRCIRPIGKRKTRICPNPSARQVGRTLHRAVGVLHANAALQRNGIPNRQAGIGLNGSPRAFAQKKVAGRYVPIAAVEARCAPCGHVRNLTVDRIALVGNHLHGALQVQVLGHVENGPQLARHAVVIDQKKTVCPDGASRSQPVQRDRSASAHHDVIDVDRRITKDADL